MTHYRLRLFGMLWTIYDSKKSYVVLFALFLDISTKNFIYFLYFVDFIHLISYILTGIFLTTN